MRHLTLILTGLLISSSANCLQLQPVFAGDVSWRKAAVQSPPKILSVSVKTYPVQSKIVRDRQPMIYHRKTDPGTITLHKGAVVPQQQKLFITGKKLNAPRLIPAIGLQRRDNISFNVSYTDRKHGFPANSVFDIAEDDQRQIWIASEKGLIRYDGYNYHLYEMPLNNSEIADCSMLFDKKKTLWIATENGVFFIRNDSVFSLKTNEIDLSSVACKTVFQDQDQRIWIATKNAGVLCIDGSSVKVYDKRCGLPNNYFESVFVDKKGRLYLACRDFGIIVIEPNRMRMFFAQNKTLKYPIFVSFYEDEEGIWAGSFLSGIMRMGAKDTLQYSVDGSYNEAVYSIKKAPDGIWFGCYGKGLAYYNRKEILVMDESNGLLNNLPYKLFEDSFQNLWIVNLSGFSRVNENSFYLQDLTNTATAAATNVMPNKQGTGSWITTFGQNLVYKEADLATVYFYRTPSGIDLFNYISSGVSDDDGTVWAASYGEGLIHSNKQTFTQYKYSDFTDHGIILSLAKDTHNNIWICPTRFGLIKYDRKHFLQYTKQSGLLSDDVWGLFPDAQNRPRWSMMQGFQRLNNNDIETLYIGDKLCKEKVNAVLSLNKEVELWGTNASGLLLIKDQKAYRLSVADGLGCDNIRSLIRDSAGRIWMTTEKTIESFLLNDLSVQDHQIYDQSNGSYILDGGTPFLDSTGAPYWMVGAKKLVFNSAMLHAKTKPFFSLRTVRLNTKLLPTGDEISLFPNDKIEINYSIAYWGRESNLKMSYLLISHRNDSTERQAQNDGNILINNILPGQYRLVLKGVDDRKAYYSEPVAITVKDYWYNTWLFRIMVGGFLLFCIVYYFKRQAKRQTLVNERLERKVREQTAIIEKEKQSLLRSLQTIESQNREKDVLIDEINHRVKNNLEFIAAMLEMQMNNRYSHDTIQALLGTNRRIKAMSLVHELLYDKEGRKGLSVRSYIYELVNNFREMAMDDNDPIDIELEVDDIELNSKTALSLGMIISELVSNSLKHAFTDVHDPKVCIHLKHDEHTGFVELEVSDNGNGYRQQSSASGLGTRLVDIFSRQLEGNYTMLTTDRFIYRLQFKPFET